MYLVTTSMCTAASLYQSKPLCPASRVLGMSFSMVLKTFLAWYVFCVFKATHANVKCEVVTWDLV